MSSYFVAGLIVVENIVALLFIQKTLASRYKHSLLRIIACSIFNSAFMSCFMFIFANPFSAVYLIIMVLLINMNLFVLGKDTWKARLYIFSVTFCDYSCLYVFSLAYLNFFFRNIPDVSVHKYYYSIAFPISTIVTLLVLLLLLKIGRKVVLMFKAITQASNHTFIVLVYNFSVVIIMLFSAFIMLPTMMDNYISENFTLIHSIYEMLVATLLLVVSFVVIYVQFGLEKTIGHERAFRSGIRKNTLLTYSFNATKDLIDKKTNIFKNDLWKGDKSYFKMIRNFIVLCVHPDDQSDFLEMSSQNYPWEALASYNGNSITMRFRVSPRKIIKSVNLPEQVKAVVGSSESKEWRWSELKCVITRDSYSGDALVDMSFADVDDEVLRDEQLRIAASLDLLTGIMNRGSVEKSIRDYLANGDCEGALFIADLDHFKEVNDTLGHSKGDELLKETADLISSLFKGGDIIGRLGGDEFVIFCKDTNNRAFLAKRAQELNTKARKIYETQKGDIYTSMSIGIAMCPTDGTDFETLYHHADIALYRVKAAGKNKAYFYESDDILKIFDFEKDGLKLSIPQIDVQHKKLVDLTNEFTRVISDAQDGWEQHVLNVLNEMLVYAQVHFSYEEKIMRKVNFEKFSEHKNKHDDFVAYCISSLSTVDAIDFADATNLLNFLKNWLVTHIAVEDRLYCEDFCRYFKETEDNSGE